MSKWLSKVSLKVELLLEVVESRVHGIRSQPEKPLRAGLEL